jgi:hypothetical protein
MNPSAPVRRMLAAAIVAQPLLVGLNSAVHPEVEFTASSMLDAAANGPTRWYVIHLVAAIGAMLTVPAVLGLRTLVHERGRRAADLGVVAGIVAAAILTVAFGIEASVLRLAVTSGLDGGSQLTLIDTFMTAPEFFAVPVGVLAFTLAGVLLGAALLAARAVPSWQAMTYLVGTLATLGGAPGTPVGPIAFGVMAIAAVFLARQVADDVVGMDASNRNDEHVTSL